MSGLIFMAVLLAVAVLRDWRLWPALGAWALILFAAVLVPHDARSEFTSDTVLVWLLAAAFALLMGAREYFNARRLRAPHKAR
jgi:hypothetical protein